MRIQDIGTILALLHAAMFTEGALRRRESLLDGNEEEDMQARRRVQQQRARKPSYLLPLQMEPGDLNFRFSKIPVLRGNVGALFPLNNQHYPMRGSLAKELKYNTTAESVMTSDDFELRSIDEAHYMAKVGGAPTYPNQDKNHPFWRDFRAVMEAQIHRRANGTLSDVMTPPTLWENFTTQDAADAVHGEYPGSVQALMINYFIKIGLKIDNNIIPFRGHNDFIGRNFRAARINTWATSQVGPTNFRTKWTYGRPRPEEVCWAIHNNGPLAPYCPDDLVELIDSWNLTHPFDCTAYLDTGSPRHPSYPAMHSAVSSSYLWLSVVFDLTEYQRCQALRTDWAVSYARTIAGVHYPTDNMAGLNMGTEIIASKLADLLVNDYGANRAAAEAKIARVKFDWKDFDHRTCRTSPA